MKAIKKLAAAIAIMFGLPLFSVGFVRYVSYLASVEPSHDGMVVLVVISSAIAFIISLARVVYLVCKEGWL